MDGCHDPETELTCNLAHNVQMDVSVFSVIFNDFRSVLWVLLYFTRLGGGAFFLDTNTSASARRISDKRASAAETMCNTVAHFSSLQGQHFRRWLYAYS